MEYKMDNTACQSGSCEFSLQVSDEVVDHTKSERVLNQNV